MASPAKWAFAAAVVLLVAAAHAQVVPGNVFSRGLAQEEDAPTDPAAAAAEEAQHNATQRWIYIHAVLMSVAWVGLLPLGILIAQSRWSSPAKKKVAHNNVWFWLHVAANIAAVALVIAAYAIATSDSTHMEIKKDDGSLAYTHKVLGTIAFALLLLQVAAAVLLRPNPSHRFRGAWNITHHNLGRLALVLAWVNIWLGVTWWQRGADGARGGLTRWVAPLAAAQGVIVLAYLLNQGIKKRAFREAEVEEKHTKAREARRHSRDIEAVAAPGGPEDGLGYVNGSNVYGSSIRPGGHKAQAV